METKIQVVEAKQNGDWCNIKTPEGKEVSVMITKCPKIKAQIDAAQGKGVAQFDLECKTVEKNGKTYAWDVEEKKAGGGFKGQPRDEGAIIAQSCISSACVLIAEKAGSNTARAEEVLVIAEKFFQFVMTKSTKKS